MRAAEEEPDSDTGEVKGGDGQVAGQTQTCPFCPYYTKNNTNMKNHIFTHTREMVYACPHCPFRSTQKEAMKEHITTHMAEMAEREKEKKEKVSYRCPNCPYITQSEPHFNRHVLKHQDAA